MNTMYWKKLVDSKRIIHVCDAKHLALNDWRLALYLLQKMNKYLPNESRIRITDDDSHITMRLHLFTVLSKVNELALSHGCMIHLHRDVVYAGSAEHIRHFIQLEAQDESE